MLFEYFEGILLVVYGPQESGVQLFYAFHALDNRVGGFSAVVDDIDETVAELDLSGWVGQFTQNNGNQAAESFLIQ